jgi:hypothetical protein
MPDALGPSRSAATACQCGGVVRPDHATSNQQEPACSTRGRGVHPGIRGRQGGRGEYDDEAGRKVHFIRIVPTSISGRRCTVTPPPTGGAPWMTPPAGLE